MPFDTDGQTSWLIEVLQSKGILGRLHTKKNQGQSRDKKDKAFLGNMTDHPDDQRTSQPTDRLCEGWT